MYKFGVIYIVAKTKTINERLKFIIETVLLNWHGERTDIDHVFKVTASITCSVSWGAIKKIAANINFLVFP